MLDNNGNIHPILWLITAMAMAGACYYTFVVKKQCSGRGRPGVQQERSTSGRVIRPDRRDREASEDRESSEDR
jgi:hypothetical protein